MQHQFRFLVMTKSDMGPFINYVTLKGGGEGPFSVTLCDREGRGLVDAYIGIDKNYKHSFISLSHIFTGLSCLVLVFHR